MTGRYDFFAVAAVAVICIAVISASVHATLFPGIGSRLARGERFLAQKDGPSAAAEFYAVLDSSFRAESGLSRSAVYSAALGYADAKTLTGETEEAVAVLRAFELFGAEAAARLETLTAPQRSVSPVPETVNASVVWKNALFEKILRSALSLPEGDIPALALDGIYDLCIFGSRYTGINMLSRGNTNDFISLLKKYESERELYEGYPLTDLSDLKSFKNLSYVLLYDCGKNADLDTDLPVKIVVTERLTDAGETP